MSEIQPGDLCVIVDRGTWNRGADLLWKRDLIGLTVIALDRNTDQKGRFPPYWRVAGVPARVPLIGVSEGTLYRIPPAPMTEDIDEALSV